MVEDCKYVNPHLHVLATDGCFYGEGSFTVCPTPNAKDLEDLIRHEVFKSNKSRGLRKKAGTDNEVPALIESDASPGAFRKNWARLIKKIYNIDPLVCPKCRGKMRIISAIEQAHVIEKILLRRTSRETFRVMVAGKATLTQGQWPANNTRTIIHTTPG